MADYYLPGFKGGGPIRTLENMADRVGDEFHFRIATRDRDFGESTPYDVTPNEWTSYGQSDVRHLPPGRAGRKKLLTLLREPTYDVLYLNSFFSPVFSIEPLLHRRLGRIPSRPVVLAPRGELSEGALSLKAAKKKLFLRTAKTLGLHRGVIWQASSELEEREIRSLFGPQAEVVVAPDLAPRADPAAQEMTWPEKPTGTLRILFLSRICQKKNLRYTLEMLRDVRSRIELSIVGPIEDEPYWQECLQIMDTLPPNVSVKHLGSIGPEEVPEMMQRHDLFALPTLGENFGHVILEAVSAGCPALLSDQTPWSDLETHGAGWTIPLDQPKRFTEVIEACAQQSAQMFQELRSSTLAYAANYLDSDGKTVDQNRDLFLRCLERDNGLTSSLSTPSLRRSA
jgi:glycosyltransferase involved in cell wall biosynthesis